jgi:hypothetical protein
MNTIKVDFTNEDILTALYKLATVGSASLLNMDLAALEKASSLKLELPGLIMLAMAGASTDDEREFVKVCESVLVKEEQCS